MNTMATRTRPRLMYVLSLSPDKIGGLEKFLKQFTQVLSQRGWDTVLCFDGSISEEFISYIASPNVQIERLDNQGNLGAGCSRELWALMRRYQPQVFIFAFHGVLRFFPWIARLGGCRRIYFNDHSSRAPKWVARPLSLRRRVLARILMAPLSGIISVSQFTRRATNALGATNVENLVVSNGVEARQMDPVYRSQFRERFGIPLTALVVTQVCWMVPVKGVPTLLEAACTLLAEMPETYFVLVGEGSHLQEYLDRSKALGVGDRVIFTGKILNPTGEGVFDATDVYCQPSVWQEACPLAVLEAMAVGAPLVASRIGGIPEIVRDEVSGILVPEEDPAALSAALKRLLADAGLRQQFGEAGAELVVAHHQLSNVAERYADILLS